MRSMQWQLRMLGTVCQHLLIDTGKPRKTCVEVAGRRTFRILSSSQQSGIYLVYEFYRYQNAGYNNEYIIFFLLKKKPLFSMNLKQISQTFCNDFEMFFPLSVVIAFECDTL